MDLDDVKNISVYGANCVVDISRGNDDTCRFVSAKEKNFRVEAVDGQLTVTQKSGNLLSRIIMRRIEFKLILPRSFNGRLRLRNKNGGLYLKGGNFADVDVSTKNGKFDVEDVACAEFALKMRNGSIFIKNMKAARDITLKCSNGNIKAESVAAQELTISCHNAGLSAVDIKTDKFDCSTHNGTIDASARDKLNHSCYAGTETQPVIRYGHGIGGGDNRGGRRKSDERDNADKREHVDTRFSFGFVRQYGKRSYHCRKQYGERNQADRQHSNARDNTRVRISYCNAFDAI